MFRRRAPWLILAFAAGLCLVGLPGWIAPYDRGGLLDPLMIAGLAGVAALAMMLIVGGIAAPLRAWAVMALCLPVSVAARVVLEMSQGRSSAPDIAVALVVGAAVVLPGILAALLARRLQDPRRGA